MATIRDYTVTVSGSTASVYATDTTQTAYASIPTLDEINDTLGSSCTELDIITMFAFSSLKISPMLPSGWEVGTHAFSDCPYLVYAPVLNGSPRTLSSMFQNDTSLLQPTSIPSTVDTTSYMYDGCTSLSGYMVIRSSSLTATDMFKDTVEPIYFYAPNLDSQTIEDIEQSANNGNVTCLGGLPSSITPVTDRGEGSRTTYTDMNRMVNNAVIAVSTYCPARMVYTANDIVHQDEWLALVAAAQTIDNTITESTHYSNLNKIEKALESAL